MPKSLLVSTGTSTSITADYKFLPFGSCNIKTTHANTDEIYSAVTVKEDFTVSNLYFRVNTNTRDVSTATCAFRLNGADSSLACSIPAATTGWFYDTTSRINVVSDDTCNFVIRYGSGGTGSFTFDTIMAVIDKTGYDTISYLSMVESNDYTGTAFTSLSGSNFNLSTESSTQTLLPQGVIKDHNLYTTQSRDADCSGFIRKNSTSFLPLTITASTNGYYSNFTDKVYINNNDKVNYYIQRYGTTGALSVKSHNSCFLSYTNQFPMIADTTSDLTITASSEFFYMASGKSDVYTASDTSSRISIPISGLKVSQFKLNIATNTVNNTTPIYVRRNGADTGVSITVPSSTTGTFYNDTSSQVYYKDDTVNIRIASTGTSGALGLKTTTIVWENILSSSAWYDTDWKCRSEIEIDSTYVDEAVPVIPIYLSKLDENWWNYVESDGKDIIITQNDGTSVLNYYLVSIDKVNKKGLLIANVDGYIDTTSNVKLIIYCGNALATASSTKDTFIDTGYVGMYFPGESLVDAVSTRDLTAVNSPGTVAAAAYEIDAATYSAGSSTRHIYEGTAAISNWPASLESIILPGVVTGTEFSLGIGSSSTSSIIGHYRDSSNYYASIQGDGGSIGSVNTGTVSTSTYYYMAITRDAGAGTTYGYNSGTQYSNSTTINSASSLNRTTIGAYGYSTYSYHWTGNVAYFAISSEVRSADYIATMHDAWSTTNFRHYGSSEILESWYNSSWTKRAKVTIDSTYVDEAVPVIPVYLSGLDNTWWDNVESDGKDIRITQDDGITLRDYYLVSINTTTKTGLLMVNVDGYISTSLNKDLYIYCGNSSAIASSSSSLTFSDYAAYYLPGMTTVNLANPGTYNLTAYNTPGTEASVFEGLTSATYNGTSSYHQHSGTITSAWPMSIGMLLKPSSTALQYVAALTVYTSSDNIFGIYTNSGAATGAVLGNGGSVASATKSSAVSNGTTDLLMVTRNATSGTSYIYDNSGSASNATTINAFGSADRLTIGALSRASSTLLYFAGSVSQLEYSTSARSANYFATMHDAWFTTAFRTYGATEDINGGSGNQYQYQRINMFFFFN